MRFSFRMGDHQKVLRSKRRTSSAPLISAKLVSPLSISTTLGISKWTMELQALYRVSSQMEVRKHLQDRGLECFSKVSTLELKINSLWSSAIKSILCIKQNIFALEEDRTMASKQVWYPC